MLISIRQLHPRNI